MRQIENTYFEWLLSHIYDGLYPESISYYKLLSYLHSREFTFLIDRDHNRAVDGVYLRYRFMQEENISQNSITDNFLVSPCSVLEMMTALALRCEETIMDDPHYGNRTKTWFWGMIVSLGLGDQYDDNFDYDKVSKIITKFLNREYAANGKGGLFTTRHRNQDMREVEIWYQLQYYLDELI